MQVLLTAIESKTASNGNPYKVIHIEDPDAHESMGTHTLFGKNASNLKEGWLYEVTFKTGKNGRENVDTITEVGKADTSPEPEQKPTARTGQSSSRDNSIEAQVAIKEVGECLRMPQNTDPEFNVTIPDDIVELYWDWIRSKISHKAISMVEAAKELGAVESTEPHMTEPPEFANVGEFLNKCLETFGLNKIGVERALGKKMEQVSDLSGAYVFLLDTQLNVPQKELFQE